MQNLAKRLGNRQGHYNFANYQIAHGKRVGVIPSRNRKSAQLIGNYYTSGGQYGTKSVFLIDLDLDAPICSNEWKDSRGRIDWQAIQSFLAEHYPELERYLVAAVRSTGGKGMSLGFAITPLPLVESTEENQALAREVKRRIFNIFSRHRMGPDPSAKGLQRLMCNFFKEDRDVFRCDLKALHEIQKTRLPVLTILHDYLKQFPESNYVRKRDRHDLLFYKAAVEEKLASLYCYLFDEGCEAYLSVEEICEITGLCPSTTRAILKDPATKLCTKWLEATHLGKFEGWHLVLLPDPDLSARAESLIFHGYKSSQASRTTKLQVLGSNALVEPETVSDGQRNQWIANVALRLKWKGIEENTAVHTMRSYVCSIPGARSSRNCRKVEGIVRNIYRRRPDTFASSPNVDLPDWLTLNAGEEAAETPEALIDRHSTENVTKLQEAPRRVRATSKGAWHGVVVGFRYHFSRFAMFTLRTFEGGELYTVVSRYPPKGLAVGSKVMVSGDLVDRYSPWGKWCKQIEGRIVGIVGFDSVVGLTRFKGIGLSLAWRIFEEFGEGAFSLIREGNSYLRAIRGVGPGLLERWKDPRGETGVCLDYPGKC